MSSGLPSLHDNCSSYDRLCEEFAVEADSDQSEAECAASNNDLQSTVALDMDAALLCRLLFDFARHEGAADSPLKTSHPEQHGVFCLLSLEENAGTIRGHAFVATLLKELLGVSEKGKSVKDPDKRAIVTGKALNTVRTSQSLVGHLQRLANSLASKVSAREEDFEAIVASCVTWLWSGVSSLCQMSSGTVTAETFSVDKLSVDQKAKVLYHGGWAFMRVRENINAAPRERRWEAASSSSDDTVLTVSKEELLRLVALVGSDEQQGNGTHLFVLREACLPFLVLLHNCVRDLLSERMIKQYRGDVVLHALAELLTSGQLRDSWTCLLKNVDEQPSAASTVLLQEFCE